MDRQFQRGIVSGRVRVRKAIAGYNWGIGNVKRVVRDLDDRWETGLPTETRNYLTRILGA